MNPFKKNTIEYQLFDCTANLSIEQIIESRKNRDWESFKLLSYQEQLKHRLNEILNYLKIK